MYPADAPQSTSRYLFAAYDPLRNLIHMGALAGGYLHATSLACRCCPNGSTFLCPGFLLPFFKSLLRPCLPCSSSLLSSFLPDLSDPIPDKWSTGLLPLPHNPTVFLMLAPAWLGSLHLPLGSPNSFSPSTLHVNKTRAFSSLQLFPSSGSSHAANPAGRA